MTTQGRKKALRYICAVLLGALLLATLIGAIVLLRPQWMDGLLWRLESLERRPTLSQRIFERRSQSHYVDQDRLVPTGSILLLGDSHLQALPSAWFDNAHNFSIGGESMARLSLRLPKLDSVQRASVIVLSGGTNDLLEGRSVEAVRQAWIDVLAGLPRTVRVICVGIPEPPSTDARSNDVIQVNADIRSICSARGHAFVAVQPGQPGVWQRTSLSDGVHLDQAGQFQLREELQRKIKGASP